MGIRAPRVSVGLPVYNGERFLGGAIEALLGQTFGDFEVIISDNGSTDGTEEICRRFAAHDRRIRYFRSERNRGISWNFNRVVHLASAGYFRWHCHDDLCLPTLLDRCVEVLDRTPRVVLTYGRTGIIDEAGALVGTYDEDLDLRSSSPYRRYRRVLQHYRFEALCDVHYGLMRRDILLRTPLIAPYVESDIVLIAELALRGPFYEIPEMLFLRRRHALNSTQAFPTARERLALLDPDATGPAIHPELRLLREHLGAINRVRLSRYDRIRCYTLIGRYVVWRTRGALAARMRAARRSASPASQA